MDASDRVRQIRPQWMRVALLATGIMNVTVAFVFWPAGPFLRELLGFPDGSAIYRATMALLVLLFGVGYLRCASSSRPERLFVSLAAAGKTGFVLLVTGFWLAGELPWRAPLIASPDLLFAILFFRWLSSSKEV